MSESFENVIDKYLGYRVKDRVTGIEGVVTSVCFDLYGCIQCILHPGLNESGEIRDTNWFDLNRMIIISDDPVMESPHHSLKRDAKKNRIYDKGPTNKPMQKI